MNGFLLRKQIFQSKGHFKKSPYRFLDSSSVSQSVITDQSEFMPAYLSHSRCFLKNSTETNI